MVESPSPEEFRAFLEEHKLTGRATANLVGVKDRQVRRWSSGDAKIPYAVWFTLNVKILGKPV